MRVTFLRAVGALLLIALAAPPMGRAQEPLGETGLEQEVRQLNNTLGQLVELLRRQLESSNAAVLMQRVQLMTSRIAPLEQELRTARAAQQSLQRELDEMEISAQRFEAQMARALETEDMTADEVRSLREQEQPMFDERTKQLEDRLWTAQQLVIDLAQRLDKRRTEIETWEGEIDRVLGLR